MRFVWAAALALTACASAPAESGWTELYNGRDLSGWSAHFFAEPADARPAAAMFCPRETELHLYCDATTGQAVSQGYIVTDEAYGDVVIHLEYRWGERRFPPRADQPRDSGLMFLITDLPAGLWPYTVENQIQDNDTGDIWAISTQVTSTVNPATTRYAPAEEGGASTTVGRYQGFANIKHGRMSEVDGWNTVEIVLRGDSSVHVINGHVNNRTTNIRRWDGANQIWVRHDRGRIGIQAEAAEMHIRNIRVRPVREGDPR